jgi:hypothetical protein
MMLGAKRWLLAVVGLFSASCGGGDASNGGPTPPFTYAIDPAVLTGCRAPSEPGCFRCCMGPQPNGDCWYLEGPSASDPTSSSSYNTSAGYPGPCAADCPPCAQCSTSEEQSLRQIEPRPDCDCAHIQPIEDACFAVGGCECYCGGVNGALEACPPAGN